MSLMRCLQVTTDERRAREGLAKRALIFGREHKQMITLALKRCNGSQEEEEMSQQYVSTNVDEPLMLNFETCETVDKSIAHLECELNAAVSDIADLVHSKYKRFLPEAMIENRLLNKLSEVLRNSEQAEKEIRERISAVEEDLEAYMNSGASSRLSRLRECKEKLGLLKEIEENIDLLLHTSIDEENGALLSARIIANMERQIEAMNKNESDVAGLIIGRICPALQEQLATMKGSLVVYLSSVFEQLCEIGNENGGTLHTLMIVYEHPAVTAKHLSAMQTLRILDFMLAKLCSYIMRGMCSFIITSKNPSQVFSVGEPTEVGAMKRKYEVRTDLPTAEGVRKPDLDATFQTLEKFFGCLAEDMQGLVVDDTPLIGMIGKKIAGELVDMIVKECLSVAVPYSAEEKPEFEKLLATAENFRNNLVSLGLFTSETITFKKFADSYDTVFINRRCTAFIVKARSLINAPLMPLLEVGSDEREKCEATETFMKAKLFVGRSATSKQCSSLMQLMRCKVSESCVKLFKLVEDCLKEAADSDSDVAAGRLFQTALNMVQLFVLVAPRQHEAQLSSVPLIAAVFYNNCHYICHCLMTASIDLYPQVKKAMKGPPYGMSFMESLPGLRKLAATLMESQLTQCRRQLRTILADDQILVGLHEAKRLAICEKALDGCMMHLQQLAAVWKEVLTDTVCSNSLGNLASFLLSRIDDFILKMLDIRATDAQIMAVKIQKLLESLEQLFIFGSDKCSSIHRFAESPYYRTKEIVFCLDGTLEDVSDRWCGGKGPMAQWLSAKEVCGLVEALFQNTRKRAQLLADISLSNVGSAGQ